MALPIVIDTREQTPLDFSAYPDVRIVRAKLWPGDYSLQAATRLMAVERKSVSDLIGTMTEGYSGIGATSPKRFDAELLGLAGVIALGGRAFVLVEPDDRGITAMEQIAGHHYRSGIEPRKVLAFVDSLRRNWGVPVMMSESRAHAAEIVYQTAKAANAEKLAWRPVDKIIAEARQTNEKAAQGSLCKQDDTFTAQSAEGRKVASRASERITNI